MTPTTSTPIFAWKLDLSHHLNNHTRWVNVAERFHMVASSASWLRVASLCSSRLAIFTSEVSLKYEMPALLVELNAEVMQRWCLSCTKVLRKGSVST